MKDKERNLYAVWSVITLVFFVFFYFIGSFLDYPSKFYNTPIQDGMLLLQIISPFLVVFLSIKGIIRAKKINAGKINMGRILSIICLIIGIFGLIPGLVGTWFTIKCSINPTSPSCII